MKRYFKDAYGCTATISKVKDGFRLKIAVPFSKPYLNKVYATERGARNVMGRQSDGWNEVK